MVADVAQPLGGLGLGIVDVVDHLVLRQRSAADQQRSDQGQEGMKKASHGGLLMGKNKSRSILRSNPPVYRANVNTVNVNTVDENESV